LNFSNFSNQNGSQNLQKYQQFMLKKKLFLQLQWLADVARFSKTLQDFLWFTPGFGKAESYEKKNLVPVLVTVTEGELLFHMKFSLPKEKKITTFSKARFD
jgi:hypothetical protein